MGAAPVAVVQAQAILTWGATGGGGTGTWDTSAANWYNGSAAVPWAQGSSAIFGGTAGTVTVGAPITVQNMTFSTNGYTITGNTLNPLTLSGSTPTVTLGAGISATVSSIVAGSNGLVVTGAGTLTLSSDSGTPFSTLFYSGPTTVSNGATLTFASPTVAALINSSAFFVNGPSRLIVQALNREDIRGTITFDSTGGGTTDFTGTSINGGVVLRGNLTIVSSGGAQDSVISSSGFGLNLDRDTLTLNTTSPSGSLLLSSLLWNVGSLTKIGPGTAMLTFANTYNGVTTLGGGILSVSSLANGGIASNIGLSTNAGGNLA